MMYKHDSQASDCPPIIENNANPAFRHGRYFSFALHAVLAMLVISVGAEDSAPAGPAEAPEATPVASPTPQATPEPPPPLSRRELVDSLSDAEVEQAIEAIRTSYLDGQVAMDPALRRAALEGLLIRIGPGLQIERPQSAASDVPAAPFLAEILDTRIAYVRLGTVSAGRIEEFKATLDGLEEKPVKSLILDLRGATGDFESAAEFARLLCPKGQLLFTLEKPSAKQERLFTSNRSPAFEGLVIVLTDSETRGPAEALAATLRVNLGAMIVGSDTAGAAVEFESLPLGGKAVLRLAVSRVTLPGSRPLYPGGIKPDIPVSLPLETRRLIFERSAENGVGPFVFESTQTRLDEAALVARTNPEIDYVRSQQKRSDNPPALRDTVLQRAVDLATAIQFYKPAKNR
jgi:hypothetical protein